MDFPLISNASVIALDTETTGLNWPVSQMFGFSYAVDGLSGYYDIRQTPKAMDWLRDQITGYNKPIVAHNMSFDYRMLHSGGITLPIDMVEDTVIQAYIVNEHEYSYRLDDLLKKYCNMSKYSDIYQELANLFGGRATRNVQVKNFPAAPPELMAKYAIPDAEGVLALWNKLNRIIDEENLHDIHEFEKDKIPTFIRGALAGIRVDVDYAEEAADKFTPIIADAQKKLNRLADDEINVNSSPQVKAMFAPEEHDDEWWVGKNKIGTTPNGNPSINAEILRDMDDPRAGLILEIRSMIKTQDTFLRGHVVGHSVNGRVYPNISQTKGEEGGAGTGRVQYQTPAMGQIPSRNKKTAAIVKPCFLPEEGQVWVDTDMASFEVRVFAHLVNNAKVIQQYIDHPDTDLHDFVAGITGLVRDAEYSGQPNAKQLNLSMIFNSGNGAIADKMGMPWHWERFLPRGKVDKKENYITYKKAGPEAEKVIVLYHQRLPGVKELAEGCKRMAEKRGYIHTYTGRRLRFTGAQRGHSYAASGKLIQATAADYNKENWKIIEEELNGVGRLILNTHDSYGMSMPTDWRPHFERIRARIEAPRARVPLLINLSGVGHNWWGALQGEICAE